MTNTKYNRAAVNSKVGKFGRTFAAMVGYIPASAQAKLSGKELGELADALWRACQDAKTLPR